MARAPSALDASYNQSLYRLSLFDNVEDANIVKLWNPVSFISLYITLYKAVGFSFGENENEVYDCEKTRVDTQISA